MNYSGYLTNNNANVMINGRSDKEEIKYSGYVRNSRGVPM